MKRNETTKQQDPSLNRGQTVAVIGSATYAAKARDALGRAAVRAEVVKLS